MSFKDMQNKGLIEPIPVNKNEIKAVIQVALSDIKTAKGNLQMRSWDWAHNIAYNAIKQACLALMYAHGYRPVGVAKHKNTLIFAKEALDKKYHSSIVRADKMRKERNIAMYEVSGTIDERKAESNVIFAERFTNDIVSIVENILKTI